MPPTSPSGASIGIVVQPDETSATLEMIKMADHARVDTVWLTAGRLRPDALTILAAATRTTSRVRLGTAVIPIWPRHPLALAQQIRALESLAPGRIRLGVGPSTAAAMSPYGAEFRRPLSHLREYVNVLRTLFETGGVDFRGEFLRAKGRIPGPLPTPVLASALGEGAFRFCGEITDGAITWVCPPRYVKDTGLPALRNGAASMDRDPPPVVLCVPTLVSEDARAVNQAARQHIAMYTRFQYYREMFLRAGYPPRDGPISGALVKDLVAHGSVEEVATRLRELASWSEVMVFPLTGGLTDRKGWELCLEAINLAGEK